MQSLRTNFSTDEGSAPQSSKFGSSAKRRSDRRPSQSGAESPFRTALPGRPQSLGRPPVGKGPTAESLGAQGQDELGIEEHVHAPVVGIDLVGIPAVRRGEGLALADQHRTVYVDDDAVTASED